MEKGAGEEGKGESASKYWKGGGLISIMVGYITLIPPELTWCRADDPVDCSSGPDPVLGPTYCMSRK